jgi:hypothetical protein
MPLLQFPCALICGLTVEKREPGDRLNPVPASARAIAEAQLAAKGVG